MHLTRRGDRASGVFLPYFLHETETRRVLMVNRNGVGPAFARARGVVLLTLLILGAVLLFRYDVSTPHSSLSRASSSAQLQASLARLPMSFEPNHGQAGTRV